MDLKPIVTCFGESIVYRKLNPELERRLPETATEWRRSYGRPPKTVKLKAKFVNLHESMLIGNIENASTLHRQPFFHIYWTDCQDVDEYKSKIKDSITEWQRKLRDRGIVDYLIIQVIAAESIKGNKNKIQFRGSVFDKVKSDFGGKNNDRVAQLWEPFKESQFTKSFESWQALVSKLRQLLLISFNRHLGKFEDKVRALREKRKEKMWSFTTYFLLHEELAFVFEMMGLYEEALIQYDEIDALLTQLIINSKAGESLACIDIFVRECKCCDGVPMSSGPQTFLRDLIKTQEATFIDLRHYLFARQCKLLLHLNRPWEIAQRTLDFLHNMIREVEILEISLPRGGTACSTVLTILEVMRACTERYVHEELVYNLHVALLYQYAKQKLEEIGQLCALMPGMTPAETELQTVCALLSGIGKNVDEGELDPKGPAKKLIEALSSKQAFQKLYLEQTELAIKIYKNIGRSRAAKSLGMELAQFFMNRKEYERAEPMLVNVYQVYRHERWTLLATQVLMKLAHCQKELKYLGKYAYSCSILACEQTLSKEKVAKYSQDLLQFIRDTLEIDQPIIIRAEPLLHVKDVRIQLLKGIGSVGERIRVQLDLHSGLHEEVTCRRISFSLHSSDLRRGGSAYSSKRSLRAMSPTVRDNWISSASDLSEEDLSDRTSEDNSDVASMDDEPYMPHLTRVDSVKSMLRSTEELPVAREETDAILDCCNVPLVHGLNQYTLTVQVPDEGQYFLKQLCVEIGKLNLVWPQLTLPREGRTFSVVSDPPKITLSREDKDLLIGVPQRIGVTVSVGPGTIEKDSKLEIVSKTPVLLHLVSGLSYVSSSLELNPEKTQQPYNVTFPSFHEGSEPTSSAAVVTLPKCGPYEKLEFDLIVEAGLSKQSEQLEEVEHGMTLCCKWLQPSTVCDVTSCFKRPITVRHVLHCSNEHRFVQIIITSKSSLCVNEPALALFDCPAVKAIPVLPIASFNLKEGKEMSLLWKLENCQDIETPRLINCELKMLFSREGTLENAKKSTYIYDFQVEITKTLYTIHSSIEPLEDNQKLLEGSECKLKVQIVNSSKGHETATAQKKHDLLYEIDIDTNLWMISGKNSGVITMPTVFMATCDVTLDVIPQTGGFLPLPDVKLKSYEKVVENETGRTENAAKSLEKDTEQENAAKSAFSKHSSTKLSNSPRDSPVVKPFKRGQVYNATQAIQVLVLPSNSDFS